MKPKKVEIDWFTDFKETFPQLAKDPNVGAALITWIGRLVKFVQANKK